MCKRLPQADGQSVRAAQELSEHPTAMSTLKEQKGQSNLSNHSFPSATSTDAEKVCNKLQHQSVMARELSHQTVASHGTPTAHCA